MTLFKSIWLVLLAIVVAIPVLPISFIYNIIVKRDRAGYLKNIAIGIDQLGGSVIYNQPDWTVSSWTYYKAMIQQSKLHIYFMLFIDFFFGKDHCYKSYLNEVDNLHRQLLKHKNS